MHKVELHKHAVKFIKSRTAKDRQRIIESIKKLAKNRFDENLDIKKLKEFSFYRLRIGNYRIIFEVIEKESVILINDIDNRGDIYK